MDSIDLREGQLDLLIKGGTIIDGTGESSYQGDIGIKKDLITQIGPISDGISAKTTIDATGKIVSPGFIDMHTHVDVASNGSDLLSDPYAENFIMQGTTTVIGGNCGLGSNLITDFLNKIRPIFNVGLLLGHAEIRESVMGMDNRAPSGEELEKMKHLVKEGMNEGAFGLSTGLGYSPGSYASLSEIAELCKVVAQAGGIYASHIREQANKIKESWDEIIQTGLLSKVRVHIAHVQVIGQKNWGASQDLIKMLNTARRSGIVISCDGYPYESGGTTIVGALIPNWVQAEGKMKNRLKDKNLLPGIKKEIEELLYLRGGPESVLITSCPGNPKIEKKYLNDITTIIYAQKTSRQTGHFPDTFFQGNNLFFPDIFRNKSRHGSVRSWMDKPPIQFIRKDAKGI